MFYAPWCGHCKQMKPKFVSAAAKMKDLENVGKLAAVDCTKEPKIGSRFGVKGYPTVKYFKDGQEAFDAGHAREEEAIINFMKVKNNFTKFNQRNDSGFYFIIIGLMIIKDWAV